MTMLFFAIMLFMAWRAFIYFRDNRAIAGVAASLASLLFAGGIYVDYARYTDARDTTPEQRAIAAQAEITAARGYEIPPPERVLSGPATERNNPSEWTDDGGWGAEASDGDWASDGGWARHDEL